MPSSEVVAKTALQSPMFAIVRYSPWNISETFQATSDYYIKVRSSIALQVESMATEIE